MLFSSVVAIQDEFGFEAQTAGAVQWRRGDNIFYWAGEALGWRGLRADTWLFEATVAFDEGREAAEKLSPCSRLLWFIAHDMVCTILHSIHTGDL